MVGLCRTRLSITRSSMVRSFITWLLYDVVFYGLVVYNSIVFWYGFLCLCPLWLKRFTIRFSIVRSFMTWFCTVRLSMVQSFVTRLFISRSSCETVFYALVVYDSIALWCGLIWFLARIRCVRLECNLKQSFCIPRWDLISHQCHNVEL